VRNAVKNTILCAFILFPSNAGHTFLAFFNQKQSKHAFPTCPRKNRTANFQEKNIPSEYVREAIKHIFLKQVVKQKR
jgi:hypothetical protein